ncbi:ribose-phosphate diphosphokinase [Candidatus Leptofilum sp.]|uniref:ribose-phosphate diphosphokinase n=1 Tax=Candidatus Leptofilum sp. TaxID=3241576 RepID=UPI003B5C3748
MTRNLDPDDVRLFSGRSNVPLAQKIGEHLQIPLEETKFSRFSNDNLFVQLGASVRGRIVYIVQSLTPPVSDHLVELLMMLDIAKSAAAREIHAIIPYFSYARSDKKDAPRISITARLIADLLRSSGATHVMTMTLHSPQVHGFFSIPADPLTARMTLEQFIRQRPLDPNRDVVVAPDMGRAKPAARFAAGLGLPIASADKTRVSDTEVKIGGLIRRQVQGFKHAYVYDDEIATAGSVVELSEVLVESGVEQISLICTHGLFLGPAVTRINSIPQIQEIITTDTVERPPDRQPPNLKVLSVGNVFAEAIRQNYLRRSIGELFEGMET